MTDSKQVFTSEESERLGIIFNDFCNELISDPVVGTKAHLACELMFLALLSNPCIDKDKLLSVIG